LSKVKLYCKAAKGKQWGKVRVETSTTSNFTPIKGANGPTVYFAIDIDIPEELLKPGPVPVVSVAIEPSKARVQVNQGHFPMLEQVVE